MKIHIYKTRLYPRTSTSHPVEKVIARFGGAVQRQEQDLLRVNFGGAQDRTSSYAYVYVKECDVSPDHSWFRVRCPPAVVWVYIGLHHLPTFHTPYIHILTTTTTKKTVELRFTADGAVRTRVGQGCGDMRRVNLLG